MILFASDLDNTMIYSYKKQLEDRVAVEEKDGKVLSYMTAYSYGCLRDLPEDICFTPVTTRSLEQYRRIRFPEGREPEYALVSNGGILLRKGIPDQDWYEESKKLTKSAESELLKAAGLLEPDPCRTFDLRMVDGLFLFTKSSRPEETVKTLTAMLDPEKVEVFSNGIKIYVVPGCLDKGRMLKRLKTLLGDPYTVSCGDSLFDIPLLLEADLAICPESLPGEGLWGRGLAGNQPAAHKSCRVVPEGILLSDEVFRCLAALKEAGVQPRG